MLVETAARAFVDALEADPVWPPRPAAPRVTDRTWRAFVELLQALGRPTAGGEVPCGPFGPEVI